MIEPKDEKAVSRVIVTFCESKKFGEIVLKIEAGKIVRVIATESIKI